MHDSPHEHSHTFSGEVKITVRRARSGEAGWNRGQEPEDWWKEIENRHGHVGPWNVLGYRMGQAILRETGTKWGSHELVITSHIPASTPYSCLIDGLAVATGNSEGRLDLLWSEVATPDFIHVSVRNAQDRKLRLLLRPNLAYLKEISLGTLNDLERQSRDCAERREEELFSIEHFNA